MNFDPKKHIKMNMLTYNLARCKIVDIDESKVTRVVAGTLTNYLNSVLLNILRRFIG